MHRPAPSAGRPLRRASALREFVASIRIFALPAGCCAPAGALARRKMCANSAGVYGRVTPGTVHSAAQYDASGLCLISRGRILLVSRLTRQSRLRRLASRVFAMAAACSARVLALLFCYFLAGHVRSASQ